MNQRPQTSSNEEFVDALYTTLLRRPADPAGRAFYVARLEQGISRIELTREITTSGEFFELLCRQAFGPQTGDPFLAYARPGHFQSPLPSREDVEELAGTGTTYDPATCPDIDLAVDAQLAWLKTLGPLTADLAFAQDPPGQTRFYSENDSFSLGDATLLAALMRHLRPTRIVEAGAGFSSAVMLDVSERFLGNSVRIDSIEPDPARLRSLLRGDERLSLHQARIQDADFDLFEQLGANDILFIDSSHVLKLGSDVSFLLFRVLPRLQPGVLVHIHDIAWPFEYPVDWYRLGRAWNEAYAVRAFLAFNRRFRIVLFADYLMRAHREAVRTHMPLALRQRRGIPEWGNSACSLWLRVEDWR